MALSLLAQWHCQWYVNFPCSWQAVLHEHRLNSIITEHFWKNGILNSNMSNENYYTFQLNGMRSPFNFISLFLFAWQHFNISTYQNFQLDLNSVCEKNSICLKHHLFQWKEFINMFEASHFPTQNYEKYCPLHFYKHNFFSSSTNSSYFSLTRMLLNEWSFHLFN